MKNSIGQIDELEPTLDVFAGCFPESVFPGVGAGGVSVNSLIAAWYPVFVLSPEIEEGSFGTEPLVLTDCDPTVFGSGVDLSVGDIVEVSAEGVYPRDVSALL